MREQSQFSKNQQYPEDDEQAAAGDLNGVHVPSETPVELKETTDSQRSQEEWHGQTQRINSKEQDSFGDRILRSRQVKNGGQDGTDARSPAEGECKSNHKRSPCRAATLDPMQPLVGVKRVDPHDAGEVQPEHDDKHTCDLGQRGFVPRRELTDLG